MKKGQTGIEVMVMLGIVLVISSIVLFGLNERNISVEKARQQLGAQREAEKLSNAINVVALGGKGFEANVTLTKKAGLIDADVFKVFGKARKVEMRWQGPRNETLVVSVRLLTSQVKDADVTTGLINVNNTGDTIEVKCWNSQGTETAWC